MKQALSFPRLLQWAMVSLVATAVAVGTLAAGCAGGSASTSTPTSVPLEAQQVDLIMDWIPWVLDIPIDVAQHHGFYEQQGISVHQTLPVEATDIVKFVSTGKSQFGLYYAPDTLMAREAGADLVCVGSLMSHAPVGVAFKPGFDAASPAALEGKVVSVPLVPSTRASLDSMLAAAGLKPGSVKVTDPGFELVAPLLAGAVDAAAFTQFGELVQAQTQGKKLAYLDFRDWGTPDFAFLNIITMRAFARDHPQVTRAFVRATLAGLAYAAAHPEEAVGEYVQAHPELDEKLLLAQWKAAKPFLALASSGRPAGWCDLEGWAKLGTWMQTAGLLQKTPDVQAAVSNYYLDADK